VHTSTGFSKRKARDVFAKHPLPPLRSLVNELQTKSASVLFGGGRHKRKKDDAGSGRTRKGSDDDRRSNNGDVQGVAAERAAMRFAPLLFFPEPKWHRITMGFMPAKLEALAFSLVRRLALGAHREHIRACA
jgi:hypothetical protein